MHNTQLLRAALLATLTALLAPSAHAQTYPSKSVRIIVPSTAGDGSDVLARTLANALTRSLGQSFVVDNRPGAGGSIGADAVAKSAPDGYTVFLANGTTHGATPSLYPKLPYDSVADFTPVVMIGTAPNVLVVNQKVPAQTVAEFIALAKKSPGQLTLASGGNGSISHLSIELLKSMADIKVLHVPYKGAAPALTDIASGQVSGMIINIPSALPLLQAGKLKALGVTSLKPVAALPGVPTLDAAGVPGYQTLAWFGLMVPAGTPAAVVDPLHQKTVLALKQAEVQATLAKLGVDPSGLGPTAFAAHIKSEIAKYGKIIREGGVKLD
ncbi:MAG: tripartite tricarboxylate transporter substrate binding protein [Proteobacteria bacterium]|nr:tripartite tricarboxylate transporter substrate binding protein [Pseudomonadota bacterium]